MSILEEITSHKRANLPHEEIEFTTAGLERIKQSYLPRVGFLDHLQKHSPAVIAEIKKASPSKGLLRANFDPTEIARSYVQHGAACLSVLTDEKYFQGSNDDLSTVRKQVQIPLLRKDFIVDARQVVESLRIGADCVLLIVAAISDGELKTFHRLSRDLGLEVLIEVHDRYELDRALACEPSLIGINNRDLKTFNTSLDTTLNLLEYIPKDVRVVSESGIQSSEHVRALKSAGVDTFLVGEAFVRHCDPGVALTELFGEIIVNST